MDFPTAFRKENLAGGRAGRKFSSSVSHFSCPRRRCFYVLVAGYDFSACASKDGSCRLFVVAWQDDLALELNAVVDFDLAVDEPDNDPVAVTAHVESSAGLAIETNLPLSL